jgi:hypothetical protein
MKKSKRAKASSDVSHTSDKGKGKGNADELPSF